MSQKSTRLLMMTSAAVMLVLGMGLTFAPQEFLLRGGSAAMGVAVPVAQAAGALYVGFAVLNWMAKDVVIGGIYSRPVAMGNLAHFFIMGATLVRLAISGPRSAALWGITVVYVIFTAGFGVVVFGSGPARRFRSERE